MIAPPAPVEWKPIGSIPSRSSSSMAAHAPVFVIPIKVTPTTGLSPFFRTWPACFTIPAQHAHAFAMICLVTMLSPVKSHMDGIVTISFAPTTLSNVLRPDATVVAMTFGKPMGSRFMALVAMTVFWRPPAERIPSIFPSAYSFSTYDATASIINAIFSPFVLGSSSAHSVPAALVTSSLETSYP